MAAPPQVHGMPDLSQAEHLTTATTISATATEFNL